MANVQGLVAAGEGVVDAVVVAAVEAAEGGVVAVEVGNARAPAGRWGPAGTLFGRLGLDVRTSWF